MDESYSSGVGVIDKASMILDALEGGPMTLASLVTATGLARPTAHRLAMALEHHRLIGRDMSGRFVLGPRLPELAAAAGEDRLVAAAERLTGLRDTVPVGAVLTMHAGSAAQVLLAWEDPDRIHVGLRDSTFTATTLAGVRRRGWAQSVAEREQGVASVSAPVRGPSNKVVAAVSVSGPLDRMGRVPGRQHSQSVLVAAGKLTEALRRD